MQRRDFWPFGHCGTEKSGHLKRGKGPVGESTWVQPEPEMCWVALWGFKCAGSSPMGGYVQQAQVSLGATLMRLCDMSLRGMVGQPNLSGSEMAWHSSGFNLRMACGGGIVALGCPLIKSPLRKGPSPFKGSTLNSA